MNLTRWSGAVIVTCVLWGLALSTTPAWANTSCLADCHVGPSVFCYCEGTSGCSCEADAEWGCACSCSGGGEGAEDHADCEGPPI
jgi:hypothetical protein